MSKRHVWVLHRTKASTGKQHLWCYGGMWGRGLPGGPVEGTYGCLEGPRLGPVWAGTGLYSRAPPQPSYLHSFRLHPILIFIIRVDKSIMLDFEVVILSSD